MMRALRGLTAGAVFVAFCVSVAGAKPPCTDGCRTRSPTRTARNPWRMSDKDRKDYLAERFGDYRDEFYGGGGQETLDRLIDKLGPYRDFWNRWRHDYQDLPPGSQERQTIIDKLRWVRDVLRGGRDLKNEFEASLAANQGTPEGGGDNSGGNSGSGGTTPSTPPTDTTTPTNTDTTTPAGNSGGKDSPGAASTASDPVSWILLTIGDQEQDPAARAANDSLVAEGITRAVNESGKHNASEERIAGVIESLRRIIDRARQRQSGSGSK